ncbi:hypothetical protein HPB51_019630 [Rhipicephalus microplus]|uniref:M13 family peptidase n=1 Tax=Rhipicephalus microplus TaxID=6941 RepID=A0A9J6F571_RHIMP|nr:hypothetical protein HPB51_019630 [Rhipicephalus microplus]
MTELTDEARNHITSGYDAPLRIVDDEEDAPRGITRREFASLVIRQQKRTGRLSRQTPSSCVASALRVVASPTMAAKAAQALEKRKRAGSRASIGSVSASSKGPGMTPRREQQRYKVTTIVIAVTTLLVSCGALLLFLMWARHPETTVYCSTADCLRHVTELKEAMDTSVDPCDDFYRYTCGSWKPNHKEHSMVARMFDHMTKIAIEEMEGPGDKALVPKALDFFKNCAQPRNLTAADVRTFVDFKQNLALPAYKHRPQTLHVSRGILNRAWVDPTWTPQTFAEVVRLHCHLLGSEAPPNAWDITVLKTTVEDIIGATLATAPEATGKSKLFALKEIEELMPKRADDWLSSLNRLHSPQFHVDSRQSRDSGRRSDTAELPSAAKEV